jgi:type I restriction enzyme, S subunit
MSDPNGQQLPPGWCKVSLADLVHGIEAGKSFECEPRPARDAEWGVIKVSATTWGRFDEAENKAVPASRDFDSTKEIRQGDILLSRSNTADLVGASVLVGRCRGRLLLSDKSMRLLYSSLLDARWLQGALASPSARTQMSLLATGTSDSMRNISQDKALSISLALPPAQEQIQIADALDELLSDIDAGVATLQRAREKLKLYRASVLKAAVEGALTAEWRKRHPQTEPASELLKRILAERRRCWEEGQLRKFRQKGREPPINWKAKYEEPVAPDMADLAPLPEGWCWASIEQLTTELANGFGKRAQVSGAPHIVLRLADMTNGEISYQHTRRINCTVDDVDRYGLVRNDLLILWVNGSAELVGRFVLTRSMPEQALFCDHFIRARCVFESLAVWLRKYADTNRFRRHIDLKKVSSAGQNTISQAALMPFAVPLPPAFEQDAIAEAVDDQLSVIDHLESDLDAQMKNVPALRQSILRHAFSGKLVPQDPTDEPASELLKRIGAEREQRARKGAAAKRLNGHKPRRDRKPHLKAAGPEATNQNETQDGRVADR